jgi:hypothetical protein
MNASKLAEDKTIHRPPLSKSYSAGIVSLVVMIYVSRACDYLQNAGLRTLGTRGGKAADYVRG